MKKLIFGLALAAATLGMSSFTNVKQVGKFFATTYYQVTPGVYSSSPGAGTGCRTIVANPCILTFSPALPSSIATFSYSDLHDIEDNNNSTSTPSGDNRLWQP